MFDIAKLPTLNRMQSIARRVQEMAIAPANFKPNTRFPTTKLIINGPKRIGIPLGHIQNERHTIQTHTPRARLDCSPVRASPWLSWKP